VRTLQIEELQESKLPLMPMLAKHKGIIDSMHFMEIKELRRLPMS